MLAAKEMNASAEMPWACPMVSFTLVAIKCLRDELIG